MGVILMDDSDAKQLQTDQMPPLDVSDLAVTWPKWRQQFQIYILAVHDQVPDRRKLAIFLNCLGSPGIAVATKYFPQLQDFDSVAAKEISFEQLWSHFDHLCTMAEPGTVSKSMDNFHFYELINYRFDGDLYKTRIELLSAAKKCGFQCHVCQTSYADRLVRDQLMECLPEQEKNVLKYLLQFKNPSSQTLVSQYNALHKDRKAWDLVLPYLSMCDLEAASIASPVMKYIVQSFIESQGQVQIKQCCFDRYCPQSCAEFYQKYGAIVRTLKLNNIAERDAEMVIHLFESVDDFTLQDMQILDSVIGFPTHLVRLTLTNSTIEVDLMTEWLSESYSTLNTMEVENLVSSFYACSSNQVRQLDLIYFINLKRLTVKANVLDLRLTNFFGASKLEFLKLSARKLMSGDFMCPALQELHYDIEDSYHVYYVFRSAKHTLLKLTLKNWVDGQSLFDTQVLEELKIVTPVPLRYKAEIENLNIRTKIVEYEPIPEIPEEPNLIFDLLNEYCILEVMDYLTVPDWMIFGQLDPKAERAVTSYKYPRHHLRSHHCRDSNILSNSEHCANICEAVKTFTFDVDEEDALIPYFHFASTMSALKSLTLNIVPKEMLANLPDGLEELVMDGVLEPYGDIDLTPYFRRLAPTLKILKLRYCGNNEQCLLELTNLRKLYMNAMAVSIPVLKKFLDLNSNTLEYLNVMIIVSPEEGWAPYAEVLNSIGSMRNLKRLTIDRFMYPIHAEIDGMEEGCYLVADLLRNIGSQLSKLDINVFGQEMLAILDSEELKTLSEIKIQISPPEALEVLLPIVCTMKNLKKLGLRYGMKYRETRQLKISELMALLEALPQLTHLSPGWTYETTVNFRMDLKEYLRQKNRDLWINNDKV